MNTLVRRALEACSSLGVESIALVVPFPLSDGDIAALRRDRRVRRLAIVASKPATEWLHPLDVASPQGALRGVTGRITIVGSPILVTGALQRHAISKGQRWLVCLVGDAFRRVSIPRLWLWAAADRAVDYLHKRRPGHPLRRLVDHGRSLPPLRWIWRRVIRRPDAPVGAAGKSTAYSDFAPLIGDAPDSGPETGRIVLANAGLALGGAERQLLNTISGLCDRGHKNITFLGEHVYEVPGLDHFVPKLLERNIAVRQPVYDATVARTSLRRLAPYFGQALVELPPHQARAILCLAEELASLRPEVVHTWQDPTNIRVGIAAHISGVRRIVLSVRGVAPPRAELVGLDMRAAYRALATSDRVVLVANCRAGAMTYADWLGIAPDRFRVIFNGVDFGDIVRPAAEAGRRLREQLGIGPDVPVVAGVLRAVPAKRPELWIETARELLCHTSDAHFVVLGLGYPSLSASRAARELHRTGRLHVLGKRDDAPFVMSACDALLVTSESEGTPNAVLEAQALGIPVVTTNAGGLAESILPGITGLICNEDRPGDLAQALAQALSDPVLLKSVNREARAFVVKRFGLERMISDTLAAYDRSAVALISAESP